MRRIVALALLVLFVAGCWYLGSPIWTVHQMQQAAQAGDADALARHIDFPALQKSVASEARATLTERARGEDDPLAALGETLAANLSDTVAGALITPETLRATFAAAPPEGSAKPRNRHSIGMRAQQAHIVYDDIDRFHLAADDGSGGQLRFTRFGLGWKLTGVRLPADLAKAHDGGR